MNAKRWMSAIVLIVLSVITYQRVFGDENPATAINLGSPTVEVVLKAKSGSQIEFITRNGRAIDGIDPETTEIPHLVLHRNGQLTNPDERTLFIQVDGIQVPTQGVTVTLIVETQHEEIYLDGAESVRIQVWLGSQWIPNSESTEIKTLSVEFTLEFGEQVSTEFGTVDTPTDYFRYEISLVSEDDPSNNPFYTFSKDYAFLMENQWVADLPEVREEEQGAAPDELVVYYADMFKYERDPSDNSSRLKRDQVTSFISDDLVPAMVAAYRMQSEEWGFVWYPEWTSYRSGIDSERLSVALTEPELWYHSWAPSSAHSGISISTSAPSYANYDSLVDGMMRFFHHELFHNHQRSINQHLGGDGDVSGENNVLSFFTEGMAQLASSVGGQGVEFANSNGRRDYISKADVFIAGSDLSDHSLNTSYAEMDVYTFGVYWRFLYDQCGGMDVIRKTLEVLYSQEFMIGSSQQLVETVPVIMNHVFTSIDAGACPFNTHRKSIKQFAKAIYALRLKGGRCGQVAALPGCGLYDPNNLYRTPEIARIIYSGEAQHYADGIAGSHGMDFVEVVLDPVANAIPLSVVISAAHGSTAQFDIQVLNVVAREGALHPFFKEIDPEVLEAGSDGRYCISIAEVDTESYSRLGLIITRVDVEEGTDPVGAYTIDLVSKLGC